MRTKFSQQLSNCGIFRICQYIWSEAMLSWGSSSLWVTNSVQSVIPVWPTLHLCCSWAGQDFDRAVLSSDAPLLSYLVVHPFPFLAKMSGLHDWWGLSLLTPTLSFVWLVIEVTPIKSAVFLFVGIYFLEQDL